MMNKSFTAGVVGATGYTGQELARLLGELGKVGSNLNQLARESNEGTPPYKREVLAVLASLLAVRDAVLVALGREP